MSGGTKNFSAYASLFYKNAQGMTIRSDKREIGGRFNFKFLTLNDRLELSGASTTSIPKRTSHRAASSATP